MKKIERTKINIYPKRITFYAIACMLTALLSCGLAFGVCYSYFNAKVEANSDIAVGKLSFEYINQTETDTDLDMFISRDGEESLIKNTDDTGSYYTYFMPGDTIILKGQIKNNGTIASYAIIKLDVQTFYDDNGEEKSTTATEWYALDGTKIKDSNSDGIYETASTKIDENETINWANNTN